MNVLITGATGFIGSRLALRCLEQGDTVRANGQVNNAYEAENCQMLERAGAEVVLGSVQDKALLERIVEGMDVVFHLAAAQHETNIPDQHFWDVNVIGTHNLLEVSAACGVKRFVYGSTIGVYGGKGKGILTENSTLRPENIYEVTKVEAEKLVTSYAPELPVVVVRISEVFGPGDRRLLKLFKGIQKKMFFMIGSGQNTHQPIFIDDLIDGLLLAATSRQAVRNTFLLAGQHPVTTSEMVQAISQTLGAKILPFRAPMPVFQGLAVGVETVCKPLGVQPPLHRRRMDFFNTNYAFSTQKAEKELGFVPRTSFEKGISATAKWYQEQGELPSNGKIGNGNGHMIRTHSNGKSVPAVMVEDRAYPSAQLAAQIEPFDSFWEAPDNIEKGYRTFTAFYQHNYLKHLPAAREANFLVVSCGPGYFVNLLNQQGYQKVVGIDSDLTKIRYAQNKGLNCIQQPAFEYLNEPAENFDVIICEQELNHLTKEEMVVFLRRCYRRLKEDGTLVVHSLNGANPITGADALAQNFDHFNTLTEYSLTQVLELAGFTRVKVIPLNLYVFHKNPFNYVALFAASLLQLFFRACFVLYGKNNKIFTKKIGGICKKPGGR